MRQIKKNSLRQLLNTPKKHTTNEEDIMNNLIYAFVIYAAIYLLRGNAPYIGNLPGDIYYRKGQALFFAPFTSALLIHFIICLVKTHF